MPYNNTTVSTIVNFSWNRNTLDSSVDTWVKILDVSQSDSGVVVYDGNQKQNALLQLDIFENAKKYKWAVINKKDGYSDKESEYQYFYTELLKSTLISPADNLEVSVDSLTLSWNRNTTDSSIESWLVITDITDPLSKSVVYNNNEGTNSSKILTTLEGGQEYKWEVINKKISHDDSTSESAYFSSKLPAPTNILPVNNDLVAPYSVTFTWNRNCLNSTVSSKLEVEDITDDDAGTVVETSYVGTDSAKTITTLLASKKYRWTVTNYKYGFTESKSEPSVFTTSSLPKPINIAPTDGTILDIGNVTFKWNRNTLDSSTETWLHVTIVSAEIKTIYYENQGTNTEKTIEIDHEDYQYIWKVINKKPLYPDSASDTTDFYTNKLPKPENLLPADDSTVSSSSITFTWNRNTDDSLVETWLIVKDITDGMPGTIIYNENQNTNESKTLTNLLGNNKYSWFVINKKGEYTDIASESTTFNTNFGSVTTYTSNPYQIFVDGDILKMKVYKIEDSQIYFEVKKMSGTFRLGGTTDIREGSQNGTIKGTGNYDSGDENVFIDIDMSYFTTGCKNFIGTITSESNTYYTGTIEICVQ